MLFAQCHGLPVRSALRDREHRSSRLSYWLLKPGALKVDALEAGALEADALEAGALEADALKVDAQVQFSVRKRDAAEVVVASRVV